MVTVTVLKKSVAHVVSSGWATNFFRKSELHTCPWLTMCPHIVRL